MNEAAAQPIEAGSRVPGGPLRGGRGRHYANLARLAHVSRTRITQIINLQLLAAETHEAILAYGRDPAATGGE